MPEPLHMLVVGGDEPERAAVRAASLRAGLDAELTGAAGAAEALAALAAGRLDCVVVSDRLGDGEAEAVLRGAAGANGRTPPVVVLRESSPAGNGEAVSRWLRAGASDCLTRGEVAGGRLAQSLRSAVRLRAAEEATRRADEDRRASERQFRDLFDGSPDAVFVEDLAGRVVDANVAACRLTGLGRDRLIGLDVTQLVPAKDRDRVRSQLPKVAAGEVDRMEGAVLGAAGRAVPAEVRFSRIEYRRRPALLVHVRDASERKRSEAALRESEERFRRMADTAPVLIWATDERKSCTYVNQPWLEFTGRPLREELGEGWMGSVHADDRAYMMEIWGTAFDAREPFRVEFRLRRADGEYRWVLDAGTPRFTPDGRFTGYIGSCTDITELKQVRDELTMDLTQSDRQLGQEIAERLRVEEHLSQLRSELAHVARLSTMGEMASGLAHELNQPLGAITNYLHGCVRMIQAGSPDMGRLSDAMVKAARQAQRAGRIIQRLRDFVATGKPRQTIEPIGPLVREVIELLAVEARKTGTRLVLNLPRELPPVLVDRIQVQQVMLNLMRNAVEAMAGSPGSERLISVTAGRHGPNTVAVGVSDSGPGVSEETLGRLFEPFYTTKASGMGMGLAISRSIIEAHGGRLWAAANFDRGITVRFTLPAAQRTAHDTSEAEHVAGHADGVRG